MSVPPSEFEQAVGHHAGELLKELALSAKQRGDEHEYDHCIAALKVGNSDHSDGQPCPLTKTVKLNLVDVCMIPACGCTGEAHA